MRLLLSIPSLGVREGSLLGHLFVHFYLGLIEGVHVVADAQPLINHIQHLFSLTGAHPSQQPSHLNLFFHGCLFPPTALVILLHLFLKVLAVCSGFIAGGMDEHTAEHAVLNVAHALLVVESFLALPALEILHLLLDLLLVLELIDSALGVLVSIIPVEDAPVVLGKTFHLIPVLVVFLHESLVFIVESHVLLMFVLDVEVVAPAFCLHFLDPIVVLLLLCPLDFSLPALLQVSRLELILVLLLLLG